MIKDGPLPRPGRAAVAGAAALLTVGVAACGGQVPLAAAGASAAPSGTATLTAPPVRGGTARVALAVGEAPDYIWPYTPAGRAGGDNTWAFQQLMYRPLYVFGANDDATATVNYQLSPASAPVYSGGGTTVTIRLKDWKWSDGEAVNASDVIFWLNLMRAEPRAFYGYVPGELPDNLASYRSAGPDTVVLRLKSAVSPIWFTYDQLAEVTPMPAAWDVRSAGAAAGSGGCAADSAADHWARCAAVYRYLSGQAADPAGYARSPLWHVVDGPWRLTAFGGSGTSPAASFVPNPAYSGGQRPELDGVAYYSYPSEAAEYAALRAGRLDVGYLPDRDLPPEGTDPVVMADGAIQVPAVAGAAASPAAPGGQPTPTATPTGQPLAVGGQSLLVATTLGSAFTLSASYAGGVSFVQFNYRSPALGPAYRQPYLRQTLEQLISRAQMLDTAANGYGYALSGIVPAPPADPAQPSSQWAPPDQTVNGGAGAFPYSLRSAALTLYDHGWRSIHGGVLTCEYPGTGPAQCGAGVATGTTLAMTLEYPAGDPLLAAEAAGVRADFVAARIGATPVAGPPLGSGAGSVPCPQGRGACTWDLALRPGGWDAVGMEPTGEQLLAAGARGNVGGYSDPELNDFLALVRSSGSLVPFQQYAGYVAEEVPLLWLPAAYTVVATRSSLADVGLGPLGTQFPEDWFFTR